MARPTSRVFGALWLIALGACAPTSQPPADDPADGASEPRRVTDGVGVQRPPTIAMPYRVEPACPGEGCTYGEWLACDTIELFASPGDTTPFGARLLPSQRFEVTTGAVVVDAPEVVVVTRPTRQLPSLADARTFAPGDTLFVLDYIGEGFFHAWHVDSILEVEVFWPWENFYPGDDFEYGGEVVQEGASSFWVRTTTDARAEAWLRVNDARLAVPSFFDPSPLTCS